MITTIQSQAYLVTGERKYIDRAAAEMAMYLEKIQRPNGLFYHAPAAPFSGRVAMVGWLPECPVCFPYFRRIIRTVRLLWKPIKR